MSSKILLYLSFTSAFFSSLLLNIPSKLVVFIIGWYLASVYLLLLSILFFFSQIPNPRSRLLEAGTIFVIASLGALYLPLLLVLIPLGLYVVFAPVYLAFRHGVFKNLKHVLLWYILTGILTTLTYNVLGLDLGATTLLVLVTAYSFVVHYVLLRVFSRRP